MYRTCSSTVIRSYYNALPEPCQEISPNFLFYVSRLPTLPPAVSPRTSYTKNHNYMVWKEDVYVASVLFLIYISLPYFSPVGASLPTTSLFRSILPRFCLVLCFVYLVSCRRGGTASVGESALRIAWWCPIRWWKPSPTPRPLATTTPVASGNTFRWA